MTLFRRFVRRYAPQKVRDAWAWIRDRLKLTAYEDLEGLHEYAFAPDPDPRPRLTLVIPSVAPHKAFGGVSTGLAIFLEIGRRTGADLRIITDEFEASVDRSLVDSRARAMGIEPDRIELQRRLHTTPQVAVRSQEVFVSYNWCVALNLRSLIAEQSAHFGGGLRPFIYPIQEYEPLFYPFSASHMLARMAFDLKQPCWGLFNSHQLYEFFVAQGHQVARNWVFEPKLTESLRPALLAGPTPKTKRILIYGRPGIARNCFPAIERGLTLWAERHPEFADWDVVSAGMRHAPVPFGPRRTIRSLGKLSLEAYAQLLRTSAVGLSLMSSPHPSYPPLEMAHFGIRTITNRYANKDLGPVHDNIISTPDIDAETISDALAQACREFLAAPDAGWAATSHMPAYLDPKPWTFLDEVATELQALWATLP